VEAMLDKTISALSGVFIGAPGSTFTEDILRLRRGWGTASVCDEYLCQGVWLSVFLVIPPGASGSILATPNLIVYCGAAHAVIREIDVSLRE
ncbi:hypothetical protein Tco_1545566, partial [Tanacetum coccineum]